MFHINPTIFKKLELIVNTNEQGQKPPYWVTYKKERIRLSNITTKRKEYQFLRYVQSLIRLFDSKKQYLKILLKVQ